MGRSYITTHPHITNMFHLRGKPKLAAKLPSASRHELGDVGKSRNQKVGKQKSDGCGVLRCEPSTPHGFQPFIRCWNSATRRVKRRWAFLIVAGVTPSF